MRHAIRAAFAAGALALSAAPALATPISYALDIDFNAFHPDAVNMTGTIVTNGAIGALSDSDILSWSFRMVGTDYGTPFDTSITSDGIAIAPNVGVALSGIHASATELYSISGFFEFNNYDDSSGHIYFQLSGSQYQYNDTYGHDYPYYAIYADPTPQPGADHLIATAAASDVPLPAAAGLLALGLGALGAARARRAA